MLRITWLLLLLLAMSINNKQACNHFIDGLLIFNIWWNPLPQLKRALLDDSYLITLITFFEDNMSHWILPYSQVVTKI